MGKLQDIMHTTSSIDMSEILMAYVKVKMIFATTSNKIEGFRPPPLIFRLINYEGPVEDTEEQRFVSYFDLE